MLTLNTDSLAPDAEAIESFLRDCVKDSIQLFAAPGDGCQWSPPLGRWFGGDAEAATRWAADQNTAGMNVYWSVNVTQEGLHRKTSKADIVAARFLHVDIDPNVADWDKNATRESLCSAKVPPGFVIDSGGGLQAFWLIDPTRDADDIKVGGWVETNNRALAEQYGGDRACHNIDRVMRLPGTVNHLDNAGKKRQRGRNKAMASLLVHNRDAQPIALPREAQAPASPSAGVTVSRAGPDYLDPPPSAKLRRMIEDPDAADPAKGDRSSRVYGVACEMVRQFYSDEQIASVLSNPSLPISAHCIEQGGIAAAMRQAERARKHILQTAKRTGASQPDIPKVIPVPITGADFLRKEIPPRALLLDPYLPAEGIAMLYAPRGIGKTWAALSIAYAVASGSSALKGTAPAPRRVLYLDGEMAAADLQERYRKVVIGSGAILPDDAYFRFLPNGLYRDGLPDPASAEGREWIEDLAQHVSMVVFDNISSLFRSKENDADDWQLSQDMLLSLRRRGISSLLVHHAGKAGQQRGTSRREDVADTVIALRRPDGYEAAEGAKFHWYFEKARGFMGDEAAPFEARLETKGDGVAWQTSPIVKTAKELAIDMLEAGRTPKEVIAATGMSSSSVYWLKDKVALQRKGEEMANRIMPH
ncbi:AAA family ATPase [Nguyenibacter vanlangensis]|uniref:AAA family ATPase n=1 Tax=Nguyenibacter vanlangensis TaxID=1216886 RepID=A0ABZ3D4F9_9PROT